MIHNYEKVFKNTFIRPLKDEDLENMRIWRNSPNNGKFLRQIPQITSEQQKEWFNKQKELEDYYFAIEECDKLNRLVGSASLYDFNKDVAEFGRILIGDEDAHGMKIGRNATIAILSIAFDELNLNKVILHCYKDNIPALKVYEEVGFKLIDEEISDDKLEYLMAIEKNDFKEKKYI